jgi:hypothetical protein
VLFVAVLVLVVVVVVNGDGHCGHRFLYPLSPIDDHYQSFDDAIKTDVDRKERGKEGVLHPSNSYYHEK